jgi:DNA-binding transcriptional LysR family regulator
MELRHLRYFVAVAESLHFGQAAAKLQIAQPSLSHQIRQLEAELQTTLLRRTKRRVELTDAGRLFLEEARDILARTDRAALIARRVGGGSSQPLRVGIAYGMDHSTIAMAVSEFSNRCPGLHVEVRTMPVPSQLAALLDRRLEVGFVRPPVHDSAFGIEVLLSEPLVVSLPRNHRLASKARVSLSTLVDEPFVLVQRETAPVFHEAVLRACREAGFAPHAPHEADHLQTVIRLVAAGSGVSLVPASARKIREHRVVYRSLHAPPPNLETAVAWRRDNALPMLAEFVRVARWAFARDHGTSKSRND